MDNISYIISDLIYKKYNVTRIAKELLNKGYSVDEIKSALRENKLKRKSYNKVIGSLLIIVGILANFYTHSTYINNHFRFDFSSQADFMLFNERILKPTITISMIFLGINLFIDRTRISKLLKVILLMLLGVFILTIISYGSILAVIFSIISITLIACTELPQKVENPELRAIFSDLNKNWDGTVGYVFLLLGIVLVYSSEIDFEYVKSGEKTYTASLKFADYFILNLKPFFGILGIVTSFLLSISLKKSKIALYILTGFSILFLIACLFHNIFQNLIYGCTIILITSIVIYFTNKNLKIKQFQ